MRRYSPRTVQAYVGWARRFILFNGKRHPAQLGKVEVTAFLSYLASARRVSASAQNQALAALLVLYSEVLGQGLEWLVDLVRAKRPERRPVVLNRSEVHAVLEQAAWHRVADGLPVVRLGSKAFRVLQSAREGRGS